MKVRLLTRWGSHFQGDIVGVSDERAATLAEAGIAKIIDQPAEQPADDSVEAEEKVDQPAEPPKGKSGKGDKG